MTDRAGNVLTTISGDPNFQPPQDNSNNFGLPNSVYDPDISSDGRFVTFWTTASQIEIGNTVVQTGNDNPNNAEVYLYDRLNDTLKMVSAVGGTAGNGDSGTTTLGDSEDSSWPSSMSADGRYVVFQSSADNLVAGVGDDNHDVSNIFLYDQQSGTITAITHSDGSDITGDSIRAEISADGTHVTFASDESDLQGANGIAQTYVYDTQTHIVSIVSAADGDSANAESDLASAVSANGSAIAFGSLADNLVFPTANDGNANIYLAAPGTLDVAGDSSIGGHAVVNDGTVIVESNVTLTLGDENGEPIPEGDQIYLPNISFNADADSYNAETGVLTVGDGNGHSVTINVAGGIGDGHFNFSQSGTGTLVTDPVSTPANNQAGSVSVGGPGNDNFVFHPGIGADTIVNFDPTHDTIELDHFANAQTVQQLESLITSDVHGDAVIALGHNDSITIANVSAAHLQHAAQSGHVIMH